jgi:hypothetical protein
MVQINAHSKKSRSILRGEYQKFSGMRDYTLHPNQKKIW